MCVKGPGGRALTLRCGELVGFRRVRADAGPAQDLLDQRRAKPSQVRAAYPGRVHTQAVDQYQLVRGKTVLGEKMATILFFFSPNAWKMLSRDFQ